VTGGGRGIGRAIARAFAGPGTVVAVAGRTLAQLESTAIDLESLGGSAVVVAMDVTDADAVAAGIRTVADAAGHVDVLVNNAGVGGGEPIAGSDVARWKRTIDTNLTGMFLVTRAVVPLMREGGRILNMTSVLGRFGVPGYTAYCASKHGVIGFTRALALELAPQQITVNALCPGWVDTEMAEVGMRQGAAATGQTFEQFRDQALAAVPIQRIIQPEEVAALARFLASPAASAITGQTYNICGGQTMD
jgi:NAD(P)-dependent dehydrogenase (short-subunit alcohol dehydrogenase family)